MRNFRLFLIVCFSILCQKIQACDICGCGIGGSNLSGIMPQYNKNIIGIRTSLQRFKHPNTPENKNGLNQVLQDNYLTSEIWMRYYLKPRIQTTIFVPYKHIQREQSDKNYYLKGIGDATLMLNYALINTSDSANKRIRVMWWAGGGIKLPTGKYQQRDVQKTMYPVGLQAGNGAYAWLLNNQLSIKKGNIGLNWITNYTINSTNELSYKMGNSFQSSLQLFYWKKIGCNSSIFPQLGLGYSRFEKDFSYNIAKQTSGSEQFLINGGVDFYTGKWVISGLVQNPITIKLYNSQPIQRLYYSLNIGRYF